MHTRTSRTVAALVAALAFALPASTHAQVKAVTVGSAEAAAKLQEYRDRMQANPLPPRGTLVLSTLAVGQQGRVERISAKVLQVLDDRAMLVGLEDAVGNRGRYDTIVMVHCPTAGITDGKFFGTGWRDMTGSATAKVTGTTAYNTALGSKTVFVLEPVADAAKPAIPATPEDVAKKVAELRQQKYDRAMAQAAKHMAGKYYSGAIREYQAALASKDGDERAAEGLKDAEAAHDAILLRNQEKKKAADDAARIAEQEKREQRAAVLLAYAKKVADDTKLAARDRAIERLKEIVRDFAGTKAAAEATALLKSLPR